MLLWAGCEKAPTSTPTLPTSPTTNNLNSAYVLVKISGDNQVDTINKQLSQLLKVQIKDSLGAPTKDALVTYSTIIGGGSISPPTVRTNVNGFAEFIWTLGPAADTQTISLSANVTLGTPQTFSATAVLPCPPIYGTMTDSRDGEVYQTVILCNQHWMAENLRYNPSAPFNGFGAWINISSPSTIYGRLYDWTTAQTACPSGWHLPSDTEWSTL